MKTFYKHRYIIEMDYKLFEDDFIKEAFENGLKYLKTRLDEIEYQNIIRLELDTTDMACDEYCVIFVDEVGNVCKAWFNEEMINAGDDLDFESIM